MSDCRFGVSPVNYSDPDPEQKRKKQVIDHSTGDKIKTMILCICITLLTVTFSVIIVSKIKL